MNLFDVKKNELRKLYGLIQSYNNDPNLIKTLYDRESFKYDEHLDFLKSINLLKEEKGKFTINLNSKFSDGLVINQLFKYKTDRYFLLKNYLSKIKKINNQYSYENKQNKKDKSIRDFLMNYEVIFYDEETNSHYIRGKYQDRIEKLFDRKAIPPNKLKKDLQDKLDLGNKAEERIIEHEMEQFSGVTESVLCVSFGELN